MTRSFISGITVAIMMVCSAQAAEKTVQLWTEVLDVDTAQPLACRVYIQDKDRKWYFPRSASPNGSAVPYKNRAWINKNSVEMHTTPSPHPFIVELPPGEYTVTIERGKEYFPETRRVLIAAEPVKLTIRLRRWINMAQRRWYSGDTHVHRSMEELPNIQMAEDLNVSLPLNYWTTKAFTPPTTSEESINPKNKSSLISIDDTHVIYPMNTEYEIFTINGKKNTLGAFFILNHKTTFEEGLPPVGPIAKKARQQGGLLDLDKHNWPWSMMLVAVINIDLFELSNNHIWRTEFGFTKFGQTPPKYMRIETDKDGFTEWGWIDYGFQNYYTLLNCGFRLRPTAGTASGVHPVPLGFGRVYVNIKEGFSYDAWIRGLNEGRSFVTTGPMLSVTINGLEPGSTITQSNQQLRSYLIAGAADSAYPLQRIELVINGQVARTIKPENRKTETGAYTNQIHEIVNIDSSSWIAVRCFEDRGDKRIRFAHSSPFHIDVKGKPLRPLKAEVDFLIKQTEEQIARSKDVLSKAAIDEYRRALRIYEEIAKTAR